MKTTIKKFLSALLVLLFAGSFVGLGVWQLQRAQDMQDYEKQPADTAIYPLLEKTSADGIVPPESIGKLVTTSGHYIATFKAPNQKDGSGAIADWEVGSYRTMSTPQSWSSAVSGVSAFPALK